MKHIDESDLFRILKYYGGETQARKISNAFIESRYNMQTLKTTQDVINLIHSLFGSTYPATSVFQVNLSFFFINFRLRFHINSKQ